MASGDWGCDGTELWPLWWKGKHAGSQWPSAVSEQAASVDVEWSYRWRASSAASSAPSGGGAGGAPGGWGSLWTPGLSSAGERGPAGGWAARV